MKVRNIQTNIVFNLPKNEVEVLINESPQIYEKMTKSVKKQIPTTVSHFDQNTILPLIWEK